MEELIVSEVPGPRPRSGAFRDPLTAWQTAAWRAPGATRFDGRPANDFLARADAIAPHTLSAPPIQAEPLPRWITVVAGAAIAAGLGALLGAMLAV